VSLGEGLREELARVRTPRECDRLAELSGLFHTAGSVHLRGRGEVALHLDLAASVVARRTFRLLRRFRIVSEIRTYPRRAFGRETRYQLHVDGRGRALQVLHEAGVLGSRLAPLEVPPKRVVGRACCRAAYLRGALLGAGSLSGPRAPHLEIRTATLRGSRFLASIAAAQGARLAVRDRGRHALAYAKGAEGVGGVLAAAGAADTVLALEERAVVASTRARANRLANADHANLVRTSRAAHAQLRALRKLEADDILGDLPHALAETATLRLRHPALSLRELGERCRPPATKATVHRRLKRLIERAETGA
jgi:DNA-binding protein WhiA